MSGYGAIARTGIAGELLGSGRWLPPHAAADVLGLTLNQLWAAVRAGELRSRSIGPSAKLVEVRR